MNQTSASQQSSLSDSQRQSLLKQRPFSEESFWNQPIAKNAQTDADSGRLCQLLKEWSGGQGFHINLFEWTIPVFEADAQTPRQHVRRKIEQCSHARGFVKASKPYLHANHPHGHHASVKAGIPLPLKAQTDGQEDAHLCVIDREAGIVYDMWQAQVDANGQWSTNSAVGYRWDGDGVFDKAEFEAMHNDESVHLYGPCRASGVPALAGLITHAEIEAGWIPHKLAYACECPALQEYVYPAMWTDGWLPAGVPEGSLLQLNPNVDLNRFKLSPAAKTIAQALQIYGAVLVDYAGSVTLYGEYLPEDGSKHWNGLLGEEDLHAIGFENFRVLQMPQRQCQGSHPRYHELMGRQYDAYQSDVTKPADLSSLH